MVSCMYKNEFGSKIKREQYIWPLMSPNRLCAFQMSNISQFINSLSNVKREENIFEPHWDRFPYSNTISLIKLKAIASISI